MFNLYYHHIHVGHLSNSCGLQTQIYDSSQGYFAYQLYVVKGRAGSWIAVVAIVSITSIVRYFRLW